MYNLFNYENHLRLISGMAPLVYATFTQSWWMTVMGIFMIYTGGTKYCPVFHSLGVNKELS